MGAIGIKWVGPTLDILLGIWCLIRRWVLFVLKNPTNNIWAQIFFSLLLFSWLYSFGVVLQYLESSIENSSFVFIRMHVLKIDIHIGWFWLTDRQLKLQTGLLNVCLLSLLNSFEGVNNKIIVESITLAERSPKKWTPGPHKIKLGGRDIHTYGIQPCSIGINPNGSGPRRNHGGSRSSSYETYLDLTST